MACEGFELQVFSFFFFFTFIIFPFITELRKIIGLSNEMTRLEIRKKFLSPKILVNFNQIKRKKSIDDQIFFLAFFYYWAIKPLTMRNFTAMSVDNKNG